MKESFLPLTSDPCALPAGFQWEPGLLGSGAAGSGSGSGTDSSGLAVPGTQALVAVATGTKHRR